MFCLGYVEMIQIDTDFHLTDTPRKIVACLHEREKESFI